MSLKRLSMKYFSGFCFKNESELFENFLIKSDFCIAGFSYGAIRAFEYLLCSNERVDILQLFSPAFFQDRDEKFKRIQLLSFKKDRQKYLENFYQNTIYPRNKKIDRYKTKNSIEDLKFLLEYQWNEQNIKKILKRGIMIEVYLGKNDKIINSEKALEFFRKFATVYFINKGGHLL